MAVLAVGGEIDRIARAFERGPQLPAQIGFVLDDQDPHGSFPSCDRAHGANDD